MNSIKKTLEEEDNQLIETPWGKKRWRTIREAFEQRDELLEALERCAHVIGHNDCTDGKTPNGFAVALDRARAVISALKR